MKLARKIKLILAAFIISTMILPVLPSKAEAQAHKEGIFETHIYLRYDFSMTWSEARQFCEELGGHLVTVNTQEEQQFLNDVIMPNASKSAYWIGGYQEGDIWKLLNGENIFYSNWSENEPNKSGQYMHMYLNGKWDDTTNNDSIDKHGFICEIESDAISVPMDVKRYATSAYKRYDLSMTWSEAKAYCEYLGGHLVTITSKEEQQFVETKLLPGGLKKAYWMGGKKENDQWSLITGESFIYSNWAEKEPNNSGSFLQIYYSDNSVKDNGKWDDTENHGNNETHLHGFICEWEDNNSDPNDDIEVLPILDSNQILDAKIALTKTIEDAHSETMIIINYFSIVKNSENSEKQKKLYVGNEYNNQTLYLAQIVNNRVKTIGCNTVTNGYFQYDYKSEGEYLLLTGNPQSFSIPRSYSLTTGTSKYITIKNIFSDARVTYSSSSKNVVTINSNGKLTAKKAGKAVITVKVITGNKTIKLKTTVTVKNVKK